MGFQARRLCTSGCHFCRHLRPRWRRPVLPVPPAPCNRAPIRTRIPPAAKWRGTFVPDKCSHAGLRSLSISSPYAAARSFSAPSPPSTSVGASPPSRGSGGGFLITSAAIAAMPGAEFTCACTCSNRFAEASISAARGIETGCASAAHDSPLTIRPICPTLMLNRRQSCPCVAPCAYSSRISATWLSVSFFAVRLFLSNIIPPSGNSADRWDDRASHLAAWLPTLSSSPHTHSA